MRRNVSVQNYIDLCVLSLNALRPDDRVSLIHFMVSLARDSSRAFETVCRLYQLAATGEWQPTFADLSLLIYAPLGSPALIPEIRNCVERILEEHPREGQLELGWKYVQTFSPETKTES